MVRETNEGEHRPRPRGLKRWLRQPAVAAVLMAFSLVWLCLGAAQTRRHGCCIRYPRAYVFRTPQGIRAIGYGCAEWEQLGLDVADPAANAPKGWDYAGDVSTFPSKREPGLFGPWCRSIQAHFGLNDYRGDFTPAETAAVRAEFAAWVAGPEWGGPYYSQVAAMLASGTESHVEYRPAGIAMDLFAAAFFCATIYSVPGLFPPPRAERRLREGLCPECAYSLQGLSEPGCPECGWGRRGPVSPT